MHKILIAALLAMGVSSAVVQSATASAADDKARVDATAAEQSAAEKSADSFCLRQTGSHLRAITKSRGEHAVSCASAPGRVYTREDLERTGASTTAEALRLVDPSIR